MSILSSLFSIMVPIVLMDFITYLSFQKCRKWKWSRSVVSTLWDPVDYSPPGSSLHEILQARILEWVAISSSRGIFPTQGWNPGLPHCRQTLQPLSHQGTPRGAPGEPLKQCTRAVYKWRDMGTSFSALESVGRERSSPWTDSCSTFGITSLSTSWGWCLKCGLTGCLWCRPR